MSDKHVVTEGDILILKIVGDLPDLYFTMPHNWVERLWKYCLWVWSDPPVRTDVSEKDQIMLDKDYNEKLFYKFNLFLDTMSTSEKLYPSFKEMMNQGFNIVTKSYFKPNAGSTVTKNITFLEHYILLVQVDPDIFYTILYHNLCKFTDNSEQIVSEYRSRSYRFLGVFV
jgi:hypothetical protein